MAERGGATPAEVALGWLLALSPAVVAIPGARRPETARSAAHAATLDLDEDDLAALAPGSRRTTRRASGAQVVLVMGIPGAGKSRLAEGYAARGFRRLNRDERGGSLRDLAAALDEELAAGARELVLDNTYLTRAARSYVVEAAARQGASLRCVASTSPFRAASSSPSSGRAGRARARCST